MAMYDIGTLLLINRLNSDHQVEQIWYVDDATAGGTLHNLRGWWNQLLQSGPEFGYYPNAPKTWFIVKQEHFALANEIFANLGVQITVDGREDIWELCLGQIHCRNLCEKQGPRTRLSSIASSQMQSAYAALTHGLYSKWMFPMKTVPYIYVTFFSHLRKPFDTILSQPYVSIFMNMNTYYR